MATATIWTAAAPAYHYTDDAAAALTAALELAATQGDATVTAPLDLAAAVVMLRSRDRSARATRVYVEATVDAAQIEALRTSAGAAGDLDQVAICDQALSGDKGAQARCADVMLDAEVSRLARAWGPSQ